ncbi:hypothetical protein [Motiliproteus sp.]|uniref:hypothetical protein n=1 Tax=Motiliproteus sp. TaxID=1898955 RepID=UPI003BABB459
MKIHVFSLLVLLSGAAMAETMPPGADQPPPVDPVIERLQSLQSMRLRLEQDWANYLQSARSNTGAQPIQPGSAPEVRQMRQEVNQNLARMEERFRCLDVDLKGNNGNVVLVCGDNNGGISTNNQQALGADLNVSGGGQ